METVRQNVLEVCQRPKTIMNNGGTNSKPIPVDLIIEIFSRVPWKSVGRFRCLSKEWCFMLSGPYFIELFLKKSLTSLFDELSLTRYLARPQILFACQNKDELFYFSTPQPQNLDLNSSLVVATHLTSIPLSPGYKISSPICGLVCYTHEQIVNGLKENVQVICNPSTGRSLNLAEAKMRRGGVGVYNLLGYDPIDKQFKVLSISSYLSAQVLTLGGEDLSWRKLKYCCLPHDHLFDGICINGVLYYRATCRNSNDPIVICFDVRLEKFSFLKVPAYGTLINYHGKLGLCWFQGSRCVYGGSRTIELWVLDDDFKKPEWSKNSYVLPASWKTLVGGKELRFVEMTRTNEFVLSLHNQTDPFYLLYFNLERNTIVRVEIQGIASKYRKVNTFLDHVDKM